MINKEKFVVLSSIFLVLIAGASSYNSPTEEVFFSQLNQTSSPDLDISGNNNDVYWIGDPTRVQGVQKSQGDWGGGSAKYLDGNDVLELRDNTGAYDGSFTIRAIVSPDSITSIKEEGENIISGGNGAGEATFALRYGANNADDPGQIEFRFWDGNNLDSLTSETFMNNNNVYEVTGVLDTSTDNMSIYVNGSLDASISADGYPRQDSGTRTFIGAEADGSGGYRGFMEGWVDEVKIYDKALSPNEVSNVSECNLLDCSTLQGNVAPSIDSNNPNDGDVGVSRSVNISSTISDADADTLDATLEWYNGTVIDSVSGASEPVTLYSGDLSLDYDTQYAFNISADDGSATTSKTVNFTTESQSLQSSDSSLLAEYLFDSSPPLLDYSGNNLDMSCQSGVNTASGRYGSAYFFDSSNSEYCIEDSNSEKLDINRDFSMSVNVKTTQTFDSVYKFISKQGSSNFNGYLIQSETGGTGTGTQGAFACGVLGSTQNNFLRTNEVINDGSWHEVTCTWDESESNLSGYHNGDYLKSLIADPGDFTTPAKLALGARASDLSQFFNGNLDHTKIWNRTLSSSEVNSHYQNGVLDGGITIQNLNPNDGQKFDTESSKSVTYSFDLSTQGDKNLKNATIYSNQSGSWSEIYSDTSISGSSASISYSETYSPNITVKYQVKAFDNETNTSSSNRTFSVKNLPNTFTVLGASDLHFGNSQEGDGVQNDINDYEDFVLEVQPDFITDNGDITDDATDGEFQDYFDLMNKFKSQTPIDRYWFVPGNHDGLWWGDYSYGDNGGNGVEWMYRHADRTSHYSSISKGNMKFIKVWSLDYLQTDNKYPATSWTNELDTDTNFHTGSDNYKNALMKHKRDWFRQEMEEACQNDKNVFVYTHYQIFETNGFSGQWFGMENQGWRNSSRYIKNVFEQTCAADVVWTGHTHDEPSEVHALGIFRDHSGNTNLDVSGGKVLDTRSRSDLANGTTYIANGVINYEHNNPNELYPSVYMYNLTEGKDHFTLKNFDTLNDVRKGMTANNSTTTYNSLDIPLSHPVDLGQYPKSNNFTAYDQDWDISQYSDESPTAVWYKPQEGFRAYKDGWIMSRWKYIEAKDIQALEVDKNSQFGLNHEFSSTNNSDLTGWSSWVDDPSNAPDAKYWRVNTSFNGSNDQLITDMRLSTTTEADSTPPSSSDNWTFTGFVDKTKATVELTATDSGGSGVSNLSYRVNGGNYVTLNTDSLRIPISTEGNNTLEYYAEDSAGNVEATNTEYVALKSNSAPLASFTTTTNDLELGVDASGSSDSDGSISSYEWDWTNDGNYEGSGETQSHTYGSEGIYNVKLRVTDNDGAVDTQVKTVSVSSSTDDGGDGGGGGGGGTTDTTPPDTTDNWDVSGFLDKTQAAVSLSATDAGVGVDRIEYQINGNGFTSVSGNSASVDIFTQGNNTLEYYAVDNNGNEEQTQTEYVAFKTSTDGGSGGGDGGDGSQGTVSLQLDSPQGDIDKNGATEISQTFDTTVDVNNSGTLELQISTESQTGFTAVDGKAIGINSDQTQEFSETFKVDYSNISESKQVSEELSYRLEWQGDDGYSFASSVQKFRYINNIGGSGNNATGLFGGVPSGLGVYLLLVLLLGVLALPLLIKVRLND